MAESHRAATRAAAYFRARTLAEPGQLETRLNLASSYVLQQNYEEASKVLEEGLTRPDLQPFQQALEQALAATYLRWFDVLTAQDKAGHAEPSPTGHLQKLEKALRHDPNNERALAVLAELMLVEPRPRVVIMTGHLGDPSRFPGAHAILEKPFSFEALLDLLRAGAS